MAKEKIGKLLGELLFFPLDCEQSERFSKEKKTFPFRFFFVAIVRRILETDQVCYSERLQWSIIRTSLDVGMKNGNCRKSVCALFPVKYRFILFSSRDSSIVER